MSRDYQYKRRKADELMEEYAIVLDFFPHGNPVDKHEEHRRKPVAQVLGDKYFMLLEVLPKPGVVLRVGEKVYIGGGLRDKIARIYGRVGYEELSSSAKFELPNIVESIVRDREEVFVEFFNISSPVTLKMHSLELLPRIGKKHMRVILEERRKKPFTSFKELVERCKVGDPVKIITERVVSELSGQEKYYLFVKPFNSTDAIYLGYLPRMYTTASKRRREENAPTSP